MLVWVMRPGSSHLATVLATIDGDGLVMGWVRKGVEVAAEMAVGAGREGSHQQFELGRVSHAYCLGLKIC